MRAEYDFSTMKGRKNPYAKKLKKQVTIPLGEDVLADFKGMAEEQGSPLPESDQPERKSGRAKIA